MARNVRFILSLPAWKAIKATGDRRRYQVAAHRSRSPIQPSSIRHSTTLITKISYVNFNSYIQRLFHDGVIPRRSLASALPSNESDCFAVGATSVNKSLPRISMLAKWPTAARIQLNWGLFEYMKETGAERGEVRRVQLASRTAADLRRRYVRESEGQFEIPRELSCDREHQ